MSYANNEGADQPALPCSLISTFIVHCLDSLMSLVSVAKLSGLMLASVAEQASLSLTWSETPKDTFSHDEAHIVMLQLWPWSHFLSDCQMEQSDQGLHCLQFPLRLSDALL